MRVTESENLKPKLDDNVATGFDNILKDNPDIGLNLHTLKVTAILHHTSHSGTIIHPLRFFIRYNPFDGCSDELQRILNHIVDRKTYSRSTYSRSKDVRGTELVPKVCDMISEYIVDRLGGCLCLNGKVFDKSSLYVMSYYI